MPILLSEVKTKSGFLVARSEFISEVTVEEAVAFMKKTAPGTAYEGMPFLVVGNVTGVSAEVKKALQPASPPKRPAPVAVVLSSVFARVAAGLMLRASGGAGNSEYFKTEAEALSWLDQAAAEYQRGR
jgi:hypothetical protein